MPYKKKPRASITAIEHGDDLVTIEEISVELEFSVPRIRQWITDEGFPAPAEYGAKGVARYRWQDVASWAIKSGYLLLEPVQESLSSANG